MSMHVQSVVSDSFRPMDSSPPRFSVHESSQARILVLSPLVMSDSWRPRILCLWDSPGKNTGVDYHALLDLPNPGINLPNPGLPHLPSEYWSRLLFPLPGDLLDPGINPCLLCLLHWQADFYH